MGTRLPGQSTDISPELQKLLERARAECKRGIKFTAISPEEGFEGRFDWRKTDVLIEMNPCLIPATAEYVAAHELCHVLQLARGCAIAAGRTDEPLAVAIATDITSLVLDASADSIATLAGFSMAPGFDAYLKSRGLLEELNKTGDGRRYGSNWAKIWEWIEAEFVARRQGVKPPRVPTRELRTLDHALKLANVAQRASNLALPVRFEIRESILKLPVVSKVVSALLSIGALNSSSNVEESVYKLVSILDYITAQTGHIFISKPLTDEIFVEGQWQPRPKEGNLREES